jgi:hypothetical protein
MATRRQIRRQVRRRHPGWTPAQITRRTQKRLANQQLANYDPTKAGPPPPAVQKAIDKYIGGQVSAYTKPRQSAITGYTQSLAGALGGISPAIGAAYGQAEQQQSALDTALADRLNASGQETASTLGAALAAAGQSEHPANAVRNEALGASNAAFATGSASQSQLISQGAASQAYGAQLPGIAAMGGLQASRGLQAQGQAMIPELRKEYDANELQKWIARTGLGLDKSQLRENRRQFNQGLKLDKVKLAIDTAQDVSKDAATRHKARQTVISSTRKSGLTYLEKLKKAAGTSGSNLVPGAKKSNLTYSQAVRKVRSRIAPDLRAAGVSRPRINRIAAWIVKQGGISKPTPASVAVQGAQDILGGAF